MSVPLVWAAQRLGIPTVLHEQNKRLGMANRLLAARAHRVLLSYPDTLGAYPRERARVVGNPVRAGFAKPPEVVAARRRFGLDADIPVVLFTGGSQGARRLNDTVVELLSLVEPGTLQIVWISGAADAGRARRAAAHARIPVTVFSFTDEMAVACAASDVIVSRAGACSTAEIAVLGKPSILVPYPHAADDHQSENARAFEAAGAAVVLPDPECNGQRMVEALMAIFGDGARQSAMAAAAKRLANPQAAETIGGEILALAFDENRATPAT